jgi:DNA-binding transcriptional LysR family regulator
MTTEAGECFLQRAELGIQYLQSLDDMVRRAGGSRTPVSRRCTRSQLVALIEVTENRSYSRAAQVLGIAQSSVNRAIRGLEELCELTLFVRSPSGAEPTWLCRQAARAASLFFAEIEHGADDLAELDGALTGKIRIGALPLARASIVPTALADLLRVYPDAEASIIDGPYEEQLRRLLNGQIDVIVGALRNPSPSSSLVQELLFSDPLHIVLRAGHPLAEHALSDAKELRKLRWIAPKKATPAREAFTRFFTRAKLAEPTHIIECSSMSATRELLQLTDCAALLPALQVERDVAAGLLAISPQQLYGTTRDIGLAFRESWRPTTLQNHFLQSVRDVVHKL